MEDQKRTIEFLSDPATHGGKPVECLETHISRIFLTGKRAFKLKRAVKLPYVDFSTPQLRLDSCLEEVRRNRITAPSLYMGVRRITREHDGRLRFDGFGELVDAVVEMVRFDQQGLFDRLAVDGKLTPELMDSLARTIAEFHGRAPIVHGFGGFDNIEGVLAINAAGFETSHVFPAAEIMRLNRKFDDRAHRLRERLDARETAGKVRRCHGDLHLRNICLIDDEPLLFDCIEFNDDLATADILYDLAFLLMDLWHRDLRALANLVANRYLDRTDNNDGFVLLPFFMAVRAAVRAHVIATHAESGAPAHDELIREARTYFDLADEFLETDAACVIAIGGLSGSGKSTIAEALAPLAGAPPGARIIESDRVRKALFDKSPEYRLEPEAYSSETTDRVYRHLIEQSVQIAADGATVIGDATFGDPRSRHAIESAAKKQRISFAGFWLQADPDLLRQRIINRDGGPSDATVEVLDRQLSRELGELTWDIIDADNTVDRVAREISQRLRRTD